MHRRAFVVFIGQLGASSAWASAAEAAAEESAVYEGYVNSLPKSFPKDRALVIAPYSLVLRERFRDWSSPEDALRQMPSLDRVVASRLMAACNDKAPVVLRAARLNERPKVYLPSAAALSQAPGDGSAAAWERFFKTYPRAIGLTRFSRVGFNDAVDEAAMFCHSQCDVEGGSTGEIALLRKAEGKWAVHAWKGLWLD